MTQCFEMPSKLKEEKFSKKKNSQNLDCHSANVTVSACIDMYVHTFTYVYVDSRVRNWSILGLLT